MRPHSGSAGKSDGWTDHQRHGAEPRVPVLPVAAGYSSCAGRPQTGKSKRHRQRRYSHGQGKADSFIQAGTPGDVETDLKQYEAAPYFSETNNLIIADELIINTDMPKKMSEEDQKALRDFIREAGDRSGMTETICTAISEQYYNLPV